MNGILPLWKPRGLTSHDCVIKVRRLYKTKKVGHTGTLDPEVEGVLPICIGQATKIVPYLTETKKTYIAEMTLGAATETEDSHGSVVETKQVIRQVSEQDIKKVFKEFTGRIEQIPPMFSAVKVNGRKLYEYARAGETVERPSRYVTIHDIELLGIKGIEQNCQKIKFKVECSKGTYIRTLCVDLGKAMGYPAHMSDLTRIKTGSFDQSTTYTFDQLESMNEDELYRSVLLPIDKGLEHLDIVHVDQSTAEKVFNGQKLPGPAVKPNTDPFQVQYENRLLALYQYHKTEQDVIKPIRVFHYD
ncbi:tRNA pseudouridine(55) synthase TruB [Sediminibacillus massiliensis]|uniref:tRNA pseudouridine(55) synthase TruB n=1 Tax=Sediminibacillus massiliensis TaxID=1926277 RepID=UPI0009886933|nr:tRNA pseudouridine(55) synthase TruB [Sediminibacillus massiliensis]